MLTIAEALAILARFQAAAPPSAGTKLEAVSALLRELRQENEDLHGQLQAAEMTIADQVAALELSAAAETRAQIRSSYQRSVTDQLADIFDAIATGETEAVSASDIAALEPLSWPKVSADTSAARVSDNGVFAAHDESDPLSWLREALPELLLNDASADASEPDIEVRSKLKTAPILDLLTPMQEALRPAIVLMREESERLQSGKVGRLTAEQMALTRMIRDYADSALSLVNSVEQIQTVQSGRFRADLRVFDCAELVKRAFRMMQPSALLRQNQLIFQPPADPPLAYADFEISLMVLIDLLDNAIRYTPPGGIIRVSIDEVGSHLLVNVADSGIGLNEADFPNVGKPFWRGLHQPLVRENPGSGLRLYLSQRILSFQGSELIFSGEPGVGSTFSFTLPVVKEP